MDLEAIYAANLLSTDALNNVYSYELSYHNISIWITEGRLYYYNFINMKDQQHELNVFFNTTGISQFVAAGREETQLTCLPWDIDIPSR